MTHHQQTDATNGQIPAAVLDSLASGWLDDRTFGAVFIRPDGEPELVVLTADALAAITRDGQPACIPRPPAHEHTGRLPQITRAKLNPCTATRTNGHPCRLPALDNGRCHRHAHRASTP
jgi:hypothetical protein